MSLHHAITRARRATLCGLAALLTPVGCAQAPTRPEPVKDPPQVLVELLPGRAELSVDGQLLGRGGRVVALPDLDRAYWFRASAAGFEPAERVDAGRQLAGARITLVLRPAGFGAGRMDPEDAEGLALAAEQLAARRDTDAAREYARRAAAIAPGAPATRHALEVAGGSGERTIEILGGQR
jgi:hypothetical protein